MLRSVLSLSVALALTACSPQNSSTEQQSQSAATEEAQQQLSSGVIKENMDLSVDPGDDFFRYVNGNWFDNFEIPADKSSYGAFVILRDEAQDHVMISLSPQPKATLKPEAMSKKWVTFTVLIWTWKRVMSWVPRPLSQSLQK